VSNSRTIRFWSFGPRMVVRDPDGYRIEIIGRSGK
jgi:hypothetical protein